MYMKNGKYTYYSYNILDNMENINEKRDNINAQ